MKQIVFFDLDGTLIDLRKRYYMIHKDLCEVAQIEPLPIQKYWDLKRNKISEETILKKSGLEGDQLNEYIKSRYSLLEDSRYLDYDELFKGVSNTLEVLSITNKLIIVTHRKNRKNLLSQLENLKISHLFFKVLNTQTVNPTLPISTAKLNAIKKNISGGDDISCFFGDTENDIDVGKSLGSVSVAVSLGIRTRELLTATNPDYLIDTMDMNMWPEGLKARLGAPV